MHPKKKIHGMWRGRFYTITFVRTCAVLGKTRKRRGGVGGWVCHEPPYWRISYWTCNFILFPYPNFSPSLESWDTVFKFTSIWFNSRTGKESSINPTGLDMSRETLFLRTFHLSKGTRPQLQFCSPQLLDCVEANRSSQVEASFQEQQWSKEMPIHCTFMNTNDISRPHCTSWTLDIPFYLLISCLIYTRSQGHPKVHPMCSFHPSKWPCRLVQVITGFHVLSAQWCCTDPKLPLTKTWQCNSEPRKQCYWRKKILEKGLMFTPNT